jgi:hypothetical protein
LSQLPTPSHSTKAGTDPIETNKCNCVPIKLYLQKLKLAGRQWLTPVILATQESEIRRIKVQSQPGQIVHENHHKKGLVE